MTDFRPACRGSPSCASATIFARAFDGFEPEIIAKYGKRKTNALMNDAGIVRNRAKIEGTVLFGARLS